MSYTYFLWIGLFFSTVSSASWFAKDRAVLKAQKGDWPGARTQLTRALVDAPDDAATLYDAGVASYKTGDMNQAVAYFKRATEVSVCPPSIKEQSYFNCGNTCVQQKELQKALECYDMTLKLNEKNERARHNKDVVKKMLEQQKQQEQKNQENKQNNDTKKDANDSSQQQQKENKENRQNSSNTSPDQQEKDERSDTQQDPQDSEEHGGQEKKDSDEQRAQEQKKREEHAGQQGEQEREQQEQKNHSQASQQQESGKQAREQQQEDTQEHKRQEASAKHEGKEQKLTGWMAQLLKEQEQRDARVNKQLMQVAVSKKMVGEDGQNCW